MCPQQCSNHKQQVDNCAKKEGAPGAPRSPSGLERLWLYLVSEYVTDTDTCRFIGLKLYSESPLTRNCLKKTSSVKVLFAAEPQSVCEEYHTVRSHMPVPNYSQIFTVCQSELFILRFPLCCDWKAMQEIHSHSSFTRRKHESRKKSGRTFKLRGDFLFNFDILYSSTNILLHTVFN